VTIGTTFSSHRRLRGGLVRRDRRPDESGIDAAAAVDALDSTPIPTSSNSANGRVLVAASQSGAVGRHSRGPPCWPISRRAAPSSRGFPTGLPTPETRGEVLNGLRMFLETRPSGGDVRMGEEVVESCCTSHEVVAVTCEETGERLFEQRSPTSTPDPSPFDFGHRESHSPTRAVAFSHRLSTTAPWRRSVSAPTAGGRRSEFTAPRVRWWAGGRHPSNRRGIAGPVAIGYDARKTSRGFAEELSRVLCANGFDVLLADRDRPTPLVAYAIVDRDLAGGLVITARTTRRSTTASSSFPRTARRPCPPSPTPSRSDSPSSSRSPRTNTGRHARSTSPNLTPTPPSLVESITGTTDLSELTVAYDAMHGSGRDTTDALLERAGLSSSALAASATPSSAVVRPNPPRRTFGT